MTQLEKEKKQLNSVAICNQYHEKDKTNFSSTSHQYPGTAILLPPRTPAW